MVARFVERFQGRIFGLCYQMLGHRQDAEDATQETMARALRHLARWDEERPILPWLLTIAANRCRTARGTQARRISTVSMDSVNEPCAVAESDMGHMWEEIHQALGKLKQQERTAFLMFHQEGMSYQEMSERVGRPVGTLKTWVHRARREIVADLRRRGALGEARDAMLRS